MITKSPILVTGCARSGSSMIAAAINACGAFSGELSDPSHSSKRGMFENIRIREDLVKPYFKQVGMDPMGQFPVKDISNLTPPSEWKSMVELIMQKEGYSEGAWMYKDSRSGLIWPVWNAAYPDAKWVIVRRRTGDVVNSCIKTGYMKAFKSAENRRSVKVSSEEEGWLWWVHENEKRFNEMINAGVNCKVIWPQRMVNGDYTQLYEIIDWLGLTWDNKAFNFIHPLLWGSGKNKERV